MADFWTKMVAGKLHLSEADLVDSKAIDNGYAEVGGFAIIPGKLRKSEAIGAFGCMHLRQFVDVQGGMATKTEDHEIFGKAVMNKMAKAGDIFGNAVVGRESPAAHVVARFLVKQKSEKK